MQRLERFLLIAQDQGGDAATVKEETGLKRLRTGIALCALLVFLISAVTPAGVLAWTATSGGSDSEHGIGTATTNQIVLQRKTQAGSISSNDGWIVYEQLQPETYYLGTEAQLNTPKAAYGVLHAEDQLPEDAAPSATWKWSSTGPVGSTDLSDWNRGTRFEPQSAGSSSEDSARANSYPTGVRRLTAASAIGIVEWWNNKSTTAIEATSATVKSGEFSETNLGAAVGQDGTKATYFTDLYLTSNLTKTWSAGTYYFGADISAANTEPSSIQPGTVDANKISTWNHLKSFTVSAQLLPGPLNPQASRNANNGSVTLTADVSKLLADIQGAKLASGLVLQWYKVSGGRYSELDGAATPVSETSGGITSGAATWTPTTADAGAATLTCAVKYEDGRIVSGYSETCTVEIPTIPGALAAAVSSPTVQQGGEIVLAASSGEVVPPGTWRLLSSPTAGTLENFGMTSDQAAQNPLKMRVAAEAPIGNYTFEFQTTATANEDSVTSSQVSVQVQAATTKVAKLTWPAEGEISSLPVNAGPTPFTVTWNGAEAPKPAGNGSVTYTWTSSNKTVIADTTSSSTTAMLTPLHVGATELTVTASSSSGWEGVGPASVDLKTGVLSVSVTTANRDISFVPASPMRIEAGTVDAQRLTAQSRGDNGSMINLTGQWSVTDGPGTVQKLDLSLLTSNQANANPVIIQPGPDTPVGEYELTFTPGSTAYEPTTYNVFVDSLEAPPEEERSFIKWAASNESTLPASSGPTAFTVQWDVSAPDTVPNPPPVSAGGGLVYTWTSSDESVVAAPDNAGPTALLTPIGAGTAKITVTVSLREGSSWALYVPEPTSLQAEGEIRVTAAGSTIIELTGENIETMVGLLPAQGTTLTATENGETAQGDPAITSSAGAITAGPAPEIFNVSYKAGTEDTPATCTVTVREGAQVPQTTGTWTYNIWVAPTGMHAGVRGSFTLTVTDGLTLTAEGGRAVKAVDPGRVNPGPFLNLIANNAVETGSGSVEFAYVGGTGDGPDAPLPGVLTGTFVPGTDETPARVAVGWAPNQTIEAGGPWTYRATVVDNGKIIASGTFRIIAARGIFLGIQTIDILSGRMEEDAIATTLTADEPDVTAGASSCIIQPAADINGDSANPLDASSFHGRFYAGTTTTAARLVVSWASTTTIPAGGPWTYNVEAKTSTGLVVASGQFTLTVRARPVLPLNGGGVVTAEAGSLPEQQVSLTAPNNGATAAGTVKITGAPSGSTTAAAPDIFTATYIPGTSTSPARVTVRARSDASAPEAAGTWVYTATVTSAEGDPIAAGTFTLTVSPAPGPRPAALAAPATAPSGRPGGLATVQIPWADGAPDGIGNYTVEATPVSQTVPATPSLSLALDSTGATGSVAVPAGAVPGSSYTYDVVLRYGGEARPAVRITVNVASKFMILSSSTQVPVNTAVTVTAALTGFTNPRLSWTAVGCGNPLASDVVTSSDRSTATFYPMNVGNLVVTAVAADEDGTTYTEQRVITVGADAEPTPSSSPSVIPSQIPTLSPSPSPSATASPSASPSSSASASASPSASESATASPSVSVSPSPSITPPASATPSPPTTTPRPLSPAPNAPVRTEITTVADVVGQVLVGLPISTRTEEYATNTIGAYVTSPSGTRIQILTDDYELIPTSAIVPFATGQIIRVSSTAGAVLEETPIIVQGDVLGTGELNIAQLVRLAQACTGERPLAGIYRAAGDFGRNNRIDIGDVVREAQMIVQSRSNYAREG